MMNIGEIIKKHLGTIIYTYIGHGARMAKTTGQLIKTTGRKTNSASTLRCWFLFIIGIAGVLVMYQSGLLDAVPKYTKVAVTPRQKKFISKYGIFTPDANNSMSTGRQDRLIRLEQHKRLQMLKEACQRLHLPRALPDYSNKRMMRMIVDDKFNILFNFIPKISCTTWKKVFNQLHKSHSAGEYRFLHTYSKDEIELRLNNYRKVLFVREPISRLLSAYLSKFRESLDRNVTMMRIWEEIYGKIIVQEYRHGQVEHIANSNENGWLNITLVEFVRYVTEMAGTKLTIKSDHFIPMHILANPCAIQYDFIGHFENLRIEAPYLLRFLNVQDIVAFPDIWQSRAITSLVKEYQQIPIYLFKQIQNYYRIDYELFGYSFHDTLQTIVNGSVL